MCIVLLANAELDSGTFVVNVGHRMGRAYLYKDGLYSSAGLQSVLKVKGLRAVCRRFLFLSALID